MYGKGSIITESPTKSHKSQIDLKIEENEVHLTVPDESIIEGSVEVDRQSESLSIRQKLLRTKSVDVNWDPTTDPLFAELEMHFVFRVLNSIEFMSEVPLYVNSMETHSNIRLVISTLIIFRKDLLTLPKIREGLRAFHLSALLQKSKMKLSLLPDDINTCLRLINLTLPKRFVREWSKLNEPMLECFQPNNNRTELE